MTHINSTFWQGKRVLLTGHTGFKGSWLSLWLQSLGATLRGIALEPPTNPALFDVANVAAGMEHTIIDIRDFAAVKAQMDEFRPEIIIHMAAQPLVRLSYSQPIETYATNVMGTVHVLEASRQINSVKAIVNITTDSFLKLDISKARQRLEWAPRWSLETALRHITDWHQAWLSGQDMRAVCLKQISEYGSDL